MIAADKIWEPPNQFAVGVSPSGVVVGRLMVGDGGPRGVLRAEVPRTGDVEESRCAPSQRY